jgi:hypothetical protein
MQQHQTDWSMLREQDETAWLDAMSRLARVGRHDLLDLPSLAEYLETMGRRDRREVHSSLSILIAHVLKWHYQADQRSRSWKATIVFQRQELVELLDSGVLRAFAEDDLERAYGHAVEQAAAGTGIPDAQFPTECPYLLVELLGPGLV